MIVMPQTTKRHLLHTWCVHIKPLGSETFTQLCQLSKNNGRHFLTLKSKRHVVDSARGWRGEDPMHPKWLRFELEEKLGTCSYGELRGWGEGTGGYRLVISDWGAKRKPINKPAHLLILILFHILSAWCGTSYSPIATTCLCSSENSERGGWIKRRLRKYEVFTWTRRVGGYDHIWG